MASIYFAPQHVDQYPTATLDIQHQSLIIALVEGYAAILA